jgi:hypothetical protein
VLTVQLDRSLAIRWVISASHEGGDLPQAAMAKDASNARPFSPIDATRDGTAACDQAASR